MYIFGEERESGEDRLRLSLLHLQENDHQRRPEPRHRLAARARSATRIFKVADWVKEWQEQDILEDSVRYGRAE